jgi:hypothetical protein
MPKFCAARANGKNMRQCWNARRKARAKSYFIWRGSLYLSHFFFDLLALTLNYRNLMVYRDGS